jgi:acid phosphatase family membrane protein YuiD
LILLPILVTGLTQVIKFVVHVVMTGKVDGKELFKWGGFPSSHAALVGSLGTLVWLYRGFASIEFMIVLGFGVIVLRDAMGLREFVEKHSLAINVLRKNLSPSQQKQVPHQIESVGHSPLEVSGGLLIGIGISLLTYLLLPISL